MPRYFLDTSALLKRYHTEPGSARVAAMFQAADTTLAIARLTQAEIISAFAKKVRTGVFSNARFDTLKALFLYDIRKRRLQPSRILNRHFDSAANLITSYGRVQHFLALDAIQLAAALDLHRTSPLDAFVCSDQRLLAVAQLEGLNVLDPEQP